MKSIILLLFTASLLTNAKAQLSTIITEFIPAYQQEDINYIQRVENSIYYLKGAEKTQGKKILTLFKLLCFQEQSMNITEFNDAIRQIGLSYYNVLNMNTDLNMVQVSSGDKISYLVFNKGEDMYTFSLQGSGGVPRSSYSQNFNGGVGGYKVRIVSYGKEKYKYQVKSTKKIVGI